jgi:hypothetical protein
MWPDSLVSPATLNSGASLFVALARATGTTTNSLVYTSTSFDDPPSLTVKNSGAITLDGKLDEADWNGAPTLLFGLGAHLKKQAGEFTVTGGVDVKNPFTDAGVQYSVPTKDSSLAKVKFLRKGMNLYLGITSNDKSICKFDWEGDGLFIKIKSSVGQEREYKLYWQNTGANKDTIRYEEGVVGSGGGSGFLPSGSTVNDTTNVDNGYTAEMVLQLDKLGYTAPLSSVELLVSVFDPDGFQHPMSSWDHMIGSYYKSWWGSEWGGTYRTLNFTAEPFDDPDMLLAKNAAGTITLDGKLDEADWTGAPTLLYGAGTSQKKQAGEFTVTGGVDVKNPFTDAGVEYRVPHKDSSLARVKFIQKGFKLYIGISSDDKSICKFDWEGDGLYIKIKNSVGQDQEYKLYWQNIGANKDTMRYEEPVANSGAGWGFLPSGSTVNDTTNVDNGYSGELMIQLDKLGYTTAATAVQLTVNVFDPDGFQHPMNQWDHAVGSFYKSWWGSEWGGVYRTVKLNAITGVGESANGNIPTVFSLDQNYPNPLNPSTMIRYGVPVRSSVTITIFDVMGREVTNLVNGTVDAGTYNVSFDARGLSSGMYLYRITAVPVQGAHGEPYTAAKKLVVLK